MRRFLTTPTKSGAEPSEADVTKFMMLCRARQLDPWQGDAFLIGYDSKDGPQFSLITAHQALLKRAETHEHFDGIVSGVTITTKKGVEQREGELVLQGESLVGGWAKVYRKDRSHDSFAEINIGPYNNARSQWTKDPAGMIVKCAEAKALRRAFPSSLGGMVISDEMKAVEVSDQIVALPTQSTTPTPRGAALEDYGLVKERSDLDQLATQMQSGQLFDTRPDAAAE